MSFTVLLGTLVSLFALIAVGFICGKMKMVSDNAIADLTGLLMKFFLPCMLISSMARDFDVDMLQQILLVFAASFASTLLFLLIMWVLTFVFHIPQRMRGLWTFAAASPNLGFFGFPLISVLMGSDALFLASMFSMPVNIICFTIGIKIISRDSDANAGVCWKDILTNPCNIAVAIGLLLFFLPITLPGPVASVVEDLGAATIPISMIIVGISLSKGSFRDMFRHKYSYLSTIARLIISPLLMFALLQFWPSAWGDMIPALLILIYALPGPTIVVIFARQYKSDIDLANGSIFMSSLFSLVTIPVMLALLL